MFSSTRSIWQTLLPLFMFVGCAMMQSACSCQSAKAKSNNTSLCVPQHKLVSITSAVETRNIVPGATSYSYDVTAQGAASVSLQLSTVPGRANLTPDVVLRYAGPGTDGIAGNFTLSAASAIHRCPKSFALDHEIERVRFSESDAFCVDGRRLVVVAQNGQTTEFRTWPDNLIKVVGNFEDPAASYFTAHYPTGELVEYGRTAGSRPSANGIALAWLANEQRDKRGSSIEFGYCFVKEGDQVKEFALDEIRYGSFEGDDSVDANRAVSLVYGAKENVRTSFEGGYEFQQSLRLDEVVTSVKGTLARRYELEYDQSETTGQTRLTSVQECAGNGDCYSPTLFHYAKVETGFEDITTELDAPLSLLSSPMLADFTGDGIADWLVPDTVGFSTATNPVKEWRLARNTGGAFAAPKVALLQEWPVLADPEGASDPTQIQPELGSSLDYDQDGRADVLLHDTTGTKNNHIVLLTQADGTFKEIDTGIQRPFPLGPAPEGLRNARGAVHLASVNEDSVVDLIQCSDHGDTPETAALSTWTLHVWRSGGFDSTGTIIPTLTGIPCGIEVQTLDLNNDSLVDLVVPGFLRQGGVPVELSGTFSVHRRRSDGAWNVFDTGLRTPANGDRVLFADINGDHLPDAIAGDVSGRLWTWMNTGKGFAAKPTPSLPWDGLLPQATYFHLAHAVDIDQNGDMDVLVPIVDSVSPDVPRWVILCATGGKNGFGFERVESGIPFQPTLTDAVSLADPRGPRIGDLNGDGAPDIAIHLGNRLHIFKNRAVDPDVLVGISNGNNDHDPDEPEFLPNVSIEYAHLTDESKTKGQLAKDSDFYLSKSDSANGCVYPRHCAVGSMRLVREYATNDGAGAQRRFGLRYRDGRYDRLTNEFLGFGKRILTDLDTGETTVDVYDNRTKVKIGERDVYPFIGQTQQQWSWVPGLPTEPNPNQVEMVFADRTIDVVPTNENETYFTLPTKMHTRRMQGSFSGAGTIEAYVGLVATLENATMLRDSTVEIVDFDEYRNVLEVDVSTVGLDTSTHITRIVKNDVGQWMLGLPDTQTECSTAAGSTLCRTMTQTTNGFGEVETESTSSSDGLDDTKLNVVYERDRYGNVTKIIADDVFGHHRSATTKYDDEGVFPIKQVNAKGHETLQQYDAVLGVLVKETDPNGLTTESALDGFGRLEWEKLPDGSSTTVTRTREKIAGVSRTKERRTKTGDADDETILDSLGRPIRSFSFAPQPAGQQATRVMQVFEYERLSGQIAKKSVPMAEGTPDDQLTFDEYEFDSLGREIRHTTPWNAITTTRYDGFLIDVTDPLLKHTITQIDALGRTVSIVDAANGVTTYKYGHFNALRSVTDPGNDTTTWTRDAFGRVRRLDDPDRGTTTLVNDGFGELVSSIDALGRVVTFGRDVLGRTETRTDVYAGKTLTTTWTWDKALHGIGRLHALISPNAVKTYGYNIRGQTETLKLGLDSTIFSSRLFYDDVGHVKAIDYPQPLGEDVFGVAYDYDARGFRIGVRDKTTNDAFWELRDVDDAGRYAEESFGNGTKTLRAYHNDKQALKSITTTLGGSTIQHLSYDWTPQLNLKSRTDAGQLQNKTERFRYDALNRLTCAYFSPTENPGAACASSYGYAANGNLTTKSDVGGLLYMDPKHPHAVTDAAGGVYKHDAVGNQFQRPGNVSITYTPFDLPKTITKGGLSTEFGYDGDEQRIRKTTPTSETLYFDDIFEQVTTAAGKEFRYYVFSPERVIAIVTRGGNEPGTKYLLTDHLGSIETVTDDTGKVIEKRSYDAFGGKRNPKWGEALGALSSKTTKGFTGHEEDDEFGLVNMRGRLYDPHIARFTTPDPVIADIFDGQSFNSFSYVWNSPLSFIDPSGFIPQEPTMNGQDSRAITPDEFVNLVLSSLQDETQSDTNAAGIGAAASTADTATTGASGAITKSQEGFRSFVEGLVKGNLSDNDSWSATLGSVVGGLIPGVGLVADIRDLGAAVGHVANGKDGAWLELGASIIGFAPGGDIAKGIAKGITKSATKTTAKIGAEVADDLARVVKGSTATAADGLSGAQKTAGHVHAPRGPPAVGEPVLGVAGGQRAGKPHTQAAKRKARETAGASCPDCGVTMTDPTRRTKGSIVDPAEAQGDHIYPRSKGGDGATVDDQRNIRMTCASCNNKKSDRIQ